MKEFKASCEETVKTNFELW